MKRTKHLISLLIVFMLTINIPLSGQDATGWRGCDRDGTVKDFNVPDEWPAELKKSWQVNVGEGDASPVLYDGKLYLHVKTDNHETALCIDSKSGKELWRTKLNPAPDVTGPAASHPGPRSTPCLANGKLYSLGAGGIVTCLDAGTGKVIWQNDKYNNVPQFYTGSSPLVVEGACIVQLGDKENGVLVAFDAESGNEQWKLEGVPCSYSSPVLMKSFDNLLLVQAETHLLGVSTNGELLWKIETPVERRFYNCPTPVYHENIVFVAGQGTGTRAYTITKEGDTWQTDLLWENSELGTSFNTPVVKDGYLIAHEARLGKIFCLDIKTGKKCWMDETTLNRFAALLDLGKAIVSLPATGDLIVFSPNEKSYSEVKKYKVATTDVYAHPVLAENHIFVKDKETLTSWATK